MAMVTYAEGSAIVKDNEHENEVGNCKDRAAEPQRNKRKRGTQKEEDNERKQYRDPRQVRIPKEGKP